MTCEEIIQRIQEEIPETAAESWDNVGLLAGDRSQKVTKIFLAVDASESVVEECIKQGAQMLITHHPLIFKSVKNMNEEDFIGKRIRTLIRNDISYYAMHTNFDNLKMGELAARELNLQKAETLEHAFEKNGVVYGAGKIGQLPEELTAGELAKKVKQVFQVSMVRLFGDPDTKIRTAAIVPGSGDDFLDFAVERGAQCYISGDISHHPGIDAVEKGMCVMDAGHYGLEKLFVPYMENYLKERIPGIEIAAEYNKEPFSVII